MVFTENLQNQYMDLIKEHTDYIYDKRLRKYILEAEETNDENKKKAIVKSIEKKTYDELNELKKVYNFKNVTAEDIDRLSVLNKKIIKSMGNKITDSSVKELYAKYVEKYIKDLKLWERQINATPKVVKVVTNYIINMFITLLYLQTSLACMYSSVAIKKIVDTNKLPAVLRLIGGMMNSLSKVINKILDGLTKKSVRESAQTIDETSLVTLLGIPVVVGLLTQAVPILKEVTYFFYYSRIKLSDSMKNIAANIEYNELEIKKNSAKTEEEKEQIIQRQKKLAEVIRKFAKAIDITPNANKKAKDRVEHEKKNTKKVSFDNIKNEEDDKSPSFAI